MHLELPLSWIKSSENKTKIKKIKLFDKKSEWFALGSSDSFSGLLKIIKNEQQTNNKIFIRGINVSQKNQLQNFCFNSMLAGKEALLNLEDNHFDKPSLKDLIKRGNRHGIIKEYKYSELIAAKVEEFKKLCVHGGEPELKHLYITKFIKESRLFIFESGNEWLGLIVITENSKTKYHTELMLRKKNAPIGIMEALIEHIFKLLANSGKKYFSLGEVPLIVEKDKLKNNKTKLILFLGLLFGKFYNYRGLYNFKNKFNPIWADIYITAYPKIRIVDLISLTFKTRLIKLSIYKFLRF